MKQVANAPYDYFNMVRFLITTHVDSTLYLLRLSLSFTHSYI